MKREELDAQIARLTARADAIRAQMETPFRAFLDSSKACLAGWFEQAAEDIIKADPYLTKEKGESGLIAMRQEFDRLAGSIPALVVERLGSADYWSHKSPVLPKHLSG